jgi:hypothetical protein
MIYIGNQPSETSCMLNVPYTIQNDRHDCDIYSLFLPAIMS